MGTEYSVADHKHKWLFDLGKGPWTLLMGDESGGTGDYSLKKFEHVEDFVVNFLSLWRDWGCAELPSNEAEHLREVAARLWVFCKNADWQVTLVNDVDDSRLDLWRDKHYVEVDNRYNNDYPPRGGWHNWMEDGESKAKYFEPGEMWKRFRTFVPYHYRPFIPEWDKMPGGVKDAFIEVVAELEAAVDLLRRMDKEHRSE